MPPQLAEPAATVNDGTAARPGDDGSSAPPPPAPSELPEKQPFRFFDLPSELRLRVYERLLLLNQAVDLDPDLFRLIRSRFALFFVSRRMHEEASHVFYSQPIRLFPLHGRYFYTKKPLVERLPSHYRKLITTFEWRLGPGWSRPPKCQHTNPSLGLGDCTSLRKLKILVHLDPSDEFFAGWRGKDATEDTYKWFCVDLLAGILEQVPTLEIVEIDAYDSVQQDSPLVSALRRMVEEAGKVLTWGPLRGWRSDNGLPAVVDLADAKVTLGIAGAPTERCTT